jgi:parallel beta-helix repeat protein
MSREIRRRHLLALVAGAGAASAASVAGLGTPAAGAGGATGVGTMDVYNVRDYGAAGDYDPATRTGRDDRNSIRFAMAVIASRGGGVLYFPPGRYRTTLGGAPDSSLIQMVSHTHVVFDPAAVLHVDAADTTARYNVIDCVGATDASVRYARIVGNAVTRGAPYDAIGIRLLGCDGVSVEQCRVSRVPGTGILVGPSSAVPARDTTIVRCIVDGNIGRGIQITAADGVVLSGNSVEGQLLGIDLEPASGHSVVSARLQGNHCTANGYGVRLSELTGAIESIQVVGNTLVRNNGPGLRGAGRNVTVSANTSRANSGDGVHLEGGGATVTGNVCVNNTGAGIRVATADSVVTANRVQGNGGGGVVDTGTGNVVAQNVVT